MTQSSKIYRYIKTPKGWRYVPAILNKEGVPLAGMALVRGAMMSVNGDYYVRHMRQWIHAGETPESALSTSLRLTNAPAGVLGAKPVTLQQQMRDWLETYDIGKAKKTRQAMARVLKNFHTYSDGKIPTAKDVTVAHVAGYWQWELDHSPTKSERTTFGRLVALNKFLVDHDVSVIGRGKNQWRIPSFDEKLIEIYEPEEVKALLAASDPRHRAAYTTMYQGLFRDQEVVYLGWADVDSTRCILHVRSKPQYGFRVKKCHERSVTVPRALVDLIMSLPHHGPLVFADDNKPDHDLLSDLKTIAKKAGVDPKRAKLHSFRRTGATHYAQKGLPLPELMRIGGWRDLKSVQRYLGHMHQDRLSTLVESAWA